MKKTGLILLIVGQLFFLSCGEDEDNPTPQGTEINTNIPETVWSDVMGGSSTLKRGAISFDDQSNIYLAGVYDGNPQVNDLPSVTVGLPNGYIRKFDEDGEGLFTQDLGFSVANDLHYLAFTEDAILLAGSYRSSGSVFYFSLDEEGNQLGLNIFDGSGRNDEAGGLAIDPEGNILIGGTFGGGLGEVAEVFKLDAAENEQWSYNSEGRTTLANVETDELGNVYLNQCRFTNSGKTEIVKLDTDGNIIWTKPFDFGCGDGLSVVSSNEIYFNYLTGVMRLDSNGDIIWQIDSQEAAILSDLDANANGDIVISGSYSFGGQFGNIELPRPSLTQNTKFIAMINANGTVRWLTNQIGATDVALNANGSVFYADFAEGQTSFGLLR